MRFRFAMIVVGMLVAGCSGKPEECAPFFECENHPRQATRVLDVQVARGARGDATLYDGHFDGGELNSLGRKKLEWMAKDNDAAFPLTVYVAVDEESAFSAREGSVRRFAEDAGLTAEQVRIVRGVNPASVHPAAPAIARASKTESGELSEAGSGASGAASLNPGAGEAR